ncbi:MAG: AAA family ATPase [Candidatus Micrarchaeota archaeon]|nr:AAA family ATPase [Candidatus Micrarchaeota archaeon]
MVIYVGLSGTMLSGKGLIREIIKKNFKTYDIGLSDMLREEADRRGIEKTRDNLRDLADELRLKNGPGILAELAIKKFQSLGDKVLDYDVIVIDSIRNPWEAEALRQTFKRYFYLIFVDADVKTRYERALQRKREGEEAVDFEAFRKSDEIEFKGREDRKIEDKESEHGGTIDYGVNLSACLRKANVRIINEGSKEEIEKKVVSLIKKRMEEVKEHIE